MCARLSADMTKVWFAVKEEEARRKVQAAESTVQAKEEQKAQRDEMRKELLGEK